jgi:membrane protease YdiL (CAAX protease family)
MGIFYVFNLDDALFTEKKQESIDMLDALNIIFIAPLVETFIFQAVPFYFLSLFSFFKENKIFIAIISAVIFASCHHDSLVRILTTFLCGFLLAAIFILREKNKGFWIVCVTHAIWNASVILIELMKKH